MEEEQREQRNEIVDELKEFGSQLQGLIRTVAESEKSKELQQDISKGIDEIGRQIDSVRKQAQSTQVAKGLGAQVQKVAEAPKVAGASQEIRTGLLRGLQELNTQLKRMAERIESQKQASDEMPSDETPSGDTPPDEAVS
jgi:heparin binding hemagglutinin HbhA